LRAPGRVPPSCRGSAGRRPTRRTLSARRSHSAPCRRGYAWCRVAPATRQSLRPSSLLAAPSLPCLRQRGDAGTERRFPVAVLVLSAGDLDVREVVTFFREHVPEVLVRRLDADRGAAGGPRLGAADFEIEARVASRQRRELRR